MAYVDLSGRRFEKFVAQWPAGRKWRAVYWLCLCDCGNLRVVARANLLNGHQKSCGCFRQVRLTEHGHARTLHSGGLSREYRSWQSMKDRCLNPNGSRYSSYGGAGIRVCGRWDNSFLHFLADMGPRPPRTSLDRFPDPNGNYEPGNCRWATAKEQRHNRRFQKTKRVVES
jgi:hypothetical protein